MPLTALQSLCLTQLCPCAAACIGSESIFSGYGAVLTRALHTPALTPKMPPSCLSSSDLGSPGIFTNAAYDANL